jgi:hypothetical protein
MSDVMITRSNSTGEYIWLSHVDRTIKNVVNISTHRQKHTASLDRHLLSIVREHLITVCS